MSDAHKEQAPEIVREWSEHDMDEHYGSDYLRDEFGADRLEERIASALATRDTQVREVLEGLRSKEYVSLGKFCWCRNPGTATRPEGDRHDAECVIAQALYEKLSKQGGQTLTN